MTVLEGPDYQNARDRIKGNPIIKMMAASVAAVPLAQIAHEDGTPRFAFMQQANRAFDDAEARTTGNPRYEPYPAGADRHLGLIAEAVLAQRAAVRKTVASSRPYPVTPDRIPACPAGRAGDPRPEGDGIAVDIATRAGLVTVVFTSAASVGARPAGTAFSYRDRCYTGSVYLAGPSWRGTPGPELSLFPAGPPGSGPT